ncbi:MAG: phosphodiesterase [Alphaproteobacteria bacterium]|nr:phosphodiesterase [Alphaproteobacteria bacterium]
MLIVHISDLHFLPKGVLSFGKVDTHGHLERCVAAIQAFQPRPDAVLITGDLTNDGDLRAYQALADMLSVLDRPIYPIPGNHDDRELIRAVFPDIKALSASGPLCYAIENWPVRIVALDSLADGKPYGRLGDEQLDWLSITLDADREKPTLVMLHHPPFKTGIGHMDWSMLRDADAFAAIIEKHTHVERVLAGHVHRAVQARFAGTIAQIPPGIAHQVKLTLGEGRGPWIMEPPGFLLHYWTDEDGLVTHEVPIGAFGPEGGFRDPHVGESH